MDKQPNNEKHDFQMSNNRLCKYLGNEFVSFPNSVKKIPSTAFDGVPSIQNIALSGIGERIWTLEFVREQNGIKSNGRLEENDYWDSDWLKGLNLLSDEGEVTDEDIGSVLEQICYCMALEGMYYIFDGDALVVCDRSDLYSFLVDEKGKEFADECDMYEFFSLEYLRSHDQLVKVKYYGFKIVWYSILDEE